MSRLSAPIFQFSGSTLLSATDSHLRITRPEGCYTLSGPGVTAEAGHLPVRGDLAHVKLAGLYFVPHYAVPMPHKIIGKTSLRSAARLDADEMDELAEGATFDVLDIAGDWAWGQYGEDGPVGYVLMGNLEVIQ